MLCKHFSWAPKHNATIRRSFEFTGSTHIRDMFTDLWKSGEHPVWTGNDILARLYCIWSSSNYIERREKAKHIKLLIVGHKHIPSHLRLGTIHRV